MGIKEIVDEAKKGGFSKEDIIFELKKKGYSREEIEEAFAGRRRKAVVGRGTVRIGSGEQLSESQKIGYLFSRPLDVFSCFYEKTIFRALSLYAIIEGILFLLLFAFSFFLGRFFGPGEFVFSFASVVSFIFIVILFGISIGGTFVYAGICHLVAKGMGGGGNYTDSYNVCTYSLIPSLMIGLIIPFVGWLSIVYSVVLMTFGLAEYHGISKGKAVVAALTPILIGILLFVLFVFYIIFVLFRGGIGF